MRSLKQLQEGRASSSKHKRILAIIGKAQNMDQAIKLVMKARNADEKKAKDLVHKAVRSAFYGDPQEAFNSMQKQKAQKSASQNKSFKSVRQRMQTEAEYQGRQVTLNKPMQGDVKKSKVYVKDPSTGNVKKVNFGDKNMKIKKNIPARRKSFRARHNCDNPGPKTKARYWSCKAW